jgi:FtsZ-binding cell division protein ZapB
MEKMLKQILEKLDMLQSDVTELKTDVAELKTSNSRIEKRQEAIFEQTAGLTEFQSETRSTLSEISLSQESISEILGKHEVQIMNLRKRSV